ncbi:MAG: hypothetical protein V8R07_04900 [Bacteroides fragilis]
MTQEGPGQQTLSWSFFDFKGGKNTKNQKYGITDIVHETYSFLHRIRALRDIGKKVKAGNLGGFVESKSNLSSETGDDA